MNIDQAKAIAIVEILTRLGIHPKRTTNHKSVYLSPVRIEKTPSFWVDSKTNRWHDFGDGQGGDPIDFARAYLKFTREADTTADALRWIKNMGVAAFEIAPVYANSDDLTKNEAALILKSKKPIQHIGLTNYLEKRGIPLEIARRHLKEIRVYNTRTQKNFTALGFPNEEGGFELRNSFFKGCLGAKAITFIRGREPKPDGIHLFEGCMDYLSAVSKLNGRGFKGDTIVLNSLSCLKQMTAYIHDYGYRVVYSWLDNDEAGRKATAALDEFVKTQFDLAHRPMNKIYTPHKDVNAWHMHKLNLTL